MTPFSVNIHATAIVVGTRGLLFTGPSGSGKSMLAFACLAAARRQGAFAALVADDRVLVSRHGNQLIASSSPSIAGLMELRGSGIVEVESLSSAVLDLAIQVVSLADAERLPPEKERFKLPPLGELPLRRLPSNALEPLAVIAALMPGFRGQLPF
ncbi:HPr kinase/phosphorylase [Rhizobium deserti]|uniref:HPr kinase/phosphorylase n=1 Tax=Rhizobium deserti TaxID=2547961 RepID=A0A4R5U7R3_9HYPH|nr:HPr kinase/phosphorylase [Rhizobium deserti]TDK30406.1 HPr kinase/phosphorylase [Rhizobium deserti]